MKRSQWKEQKCVSLIFIFMRHFKVEDEVKARQKDLLRYHKKMYPIENINKFSLVWRSPTLFGVETTGRKGEESA